MLNRSRRIRATIPCADPNTSFVFVGFGALAPAIPRQIPRQSPAAALYGLVSRALLFHGPSGFKTDPIALSPPIPAPLAWAIASSVPTGETQQTRSEGNQLEPSRLNSKGHLKDVEQVLMRAGPFYM